MIYYFHFYQLTYHINKHRSGLLALIKLGIFPAFGNISNLGRGGYATWRRSDLCKEHYQALDQTNVVCRFNCQQCPAVYERQTKRASHIRKYEHENHKSPYFVMNLIP